MLHTDWLKVATAGRTVDGREIKGEWLEQMAAVYSPKLYTATVNSEHFFHPGLGYVTALKAGTDDLGRAALYARIAPTAELLARYQNKRQLFFSMEVRSDFPAKGDHYLTGLAVTDVPASQGLEPARFAAEHEGLERYFDTACLADEDAVAAGDVSDAPPTWWSALWHAIRPHFGARRDEESQIESEPMTQPEQDAFAALQAEVETLKAQVAEMAKTPDTAHPEQADDKPKASAEAVNRFQAELDAKLTAALTPLAARIDKLEAWMAEPLEGEHGEVTGPAGGGEFIF